MAVLTCPLSLQQPMAPLVSSVQLWIQARFLSTAFCGKDDEKEKATSHRKPQGRSSFSDQAAKCEAKGHDDIYDMRLTCERPVLVRGCVRASRTAFGFRLSAARGPPKTGFEFRAAWAGHRLSEIREFR